MVDEAKYVKMAIRSQQWRFVNNKELYDVAVDPGETNNIADTNPEVISKFKLPYDQWWYNSIPLMVNENRKRVKEQPLHVRYYKQLETEGIPYWSPKE
jgi:arylsulfatase